MLALQANASKLNGPAPAAEANTSRKKNAKPTVVSLCEEPQPPASALSAALTRALGRKLHRVEIDYVQNVCFLYQQARGGQAMNVAKLHSLSPGSYDYSWEPLELWPDLPTDDLRFWLFCAWELRRRGLAVPEFMLGVTDFSLIESALKSWERQKAIQYWRTRLSQGLPESPTEIEPLDFRLMILPEEARVQWTTLPDKKFKDLKQAQLRRFSNQYQAGTLKVTAEALPLWHALHSPYDFFSACNFHFDRPETAKMLGRVLRLGGLEERIVTADEKPLARLSEALGYRLEAAKDETEDYQVELALPDGSPTPPILLALPCNPALYLSERAVFPGPPPHALGIGEPLRIPAPALESSSGVEFLQRLKLDLPPRIAERTRRVSVAVQLPPGWMAAKRRSAAAAAGSWRRAPEPAWARLKPAPTG